MFHGYATKDLAAVNRNTSSGVFWLFLLGILAFSGFWSTRFAVADSLYRQNTFESLNRAAALVPGNAAYLALLAEHKEGLGFDPEPLLTAASALSPEDSRYWIRLGFRAESENRHDQAEQYLLRAAAVDRKFDPRWALMNFYFRRARAPEFWRWTERALEFSYGDRTPLFRLAWEASQDPAEIRRHIPDNKGILTDYLGYLINYGHFEASVPLARQLAGLMTPGENTSLLLSWWDQALTRDSPSALAVWNSLCDRRVLPFSSLQPAEGKIVTDGGFSEISLQRGYAWHLSRTEGATAEPDPVAQQLSVRLSGNEPENVVLAEQFVPLAPGSQYRIAWDSLSPRPDSLPGLSWTVTSGAASLGRSPALTPGSAWKSEQFTFASGTNTFARLSLTYQRPLGSTLAEGTFAVRKITGTLVK
jgi:tetratricopeptide (TPR) repeat protein